jgi:hypothetical protein
LQDDQQRIGPGRVQQLLELAKLLHQRIELHFAGLFGDVAVTPRIDRGQIDRLAAVAAERISHGPLPVSRQERLAACAAPSNVITDDGRV